MEVLFNYKRTVEDFKQCGGKAGNPYNFPFVSECVGPSDAANGPCKDSSAPVPCGDGTCRSDYVACLRALSDAERRDGLRSSVLWAFQEYTQARQEQGLEELVGDAAVLLAQSAGDDASTAVESSAFASSGSSNDRYMETLFGTSTADDRSRGTGRSDHVVSGGGGGDKSLRRGRRSGSNGGGGGGGGGGSKLGTSSDLTQWGGTLSYDANGAKEEDGVRGST